MPVNLFRGAAIVMIRSLVESAFQTGCLSVASEGLIGQVLSMKGYQSEDLDALVTLYKALKAGQIEREARGDVATTLARYGQSGLNSIPVSYWLAS